MSQIILRLSLDSNALGPFSLYTGSTTTTAIQTGITRDQLTAGIVVDLPATPEGTNYTLIIQNNQPDCDDNDVVKTVTLFGNLDIITIDAIYFDGSVGAIYTATSAEVLDTDLTITFTNSLSVYAGVPVVFNPTINISSGSTTGSTTVIDSGATFSNLSGTASFSGFSASTTSSSQWTFSGDFDYSFSGLTTPTPTPSMTLTPTPTPTPTQTGTPTPTPTPTTTSAALPPALLFMESADDSLFVGPENTDIGTWMINNGATQWFGFNASGIALINANDLQIWMAWPGFLTGTTNNTNGTLTATVPQSNGGTDDYGNLIEQYIFETIEVPAGTVRGNIYYSVLVPLNVINSGTQKYSQIGINYGNPPSALDNTNADLSVSSINVVYTGSTFYNTTYRVYTNSPGNNFNVGVTGQFNSTENYFRGATLTSS
jgi:hypothetical protein